MVSTACLSLAPDPALPWRDALLDEAAIRTTLAALDPGGRARVSDCSIARVNYQVGKSLRAVFQITIDDEPHTVAVRMFRQGRSAAAYARACEGARPLGNLSPVMHAPELESVFWVFPNDRKIDTLVPLIEAPVPAFLDRSAKGSRARLVAYAPEKSATLAYTDEHGRTVAYAKVTAACEAERDYTTYEHLRAGLSQTDPWLRLPCPLAYSIEYRTLWLEAMHGRRLADPTDSSTGSAHMDLDDLRRFGSAVAAFHGLSAPGAPRFDRFSPARLMGEATLIARVRPDVAEACGAVARRLAAAAPPEGLDVVCLHGDLHPKNAIVCRDRLALIDVEDVAIGPAAADIGCFLATLLYLRTVQRLSRAAFVEQACAFLRGYVEVRPLPAAESITWHAAAALVVERAARAVFRIRPPGLAHLAALFREADWVLDHGLELS